MRIYLLVAAAAMVGRLSPQNLYRHPRAPLRRTGLESGGGSALAIHGRLYLLWPPASIPKGWLRGAECSLKGNHLDSQLPSGRRRS